MILTKKVLRRGKETAYEELSRHSMIPLTVKCDRCGKEFESTKYQILRNGHELCRQCALYENEHKDLPTGFKSGRLTVVRPSERVGYSVCKCECGKEAEICNTSLRSKRTKSCGCLRKENGKKQAELYLSKYHHKENHPMWKGGIAPERNCIESTNEYKLWKQSVLSKGKCEKCGSTDNLVPHHICNFRDYPKLRLEPENGACLCQNCHRKFHFLYGLVNTTGEQYKEFLEKEMQ